MQESFIIPRKPIQDERGFVLVPVMPEIPASGSTCGTCNGGCKPDRHHAYWPGPAKKKRAQKTRERIYGKLPDLSKEPYSQLRTAGFSISGLVCRS